MLSLAFREATAQDLDILVALDADSPGGGWTREAFASDQRTPWCTTEVAFAGKTPVGFSVVWWVAGEAQLLNIATLQTARGQGVGRALMERILERARGEDMRVTLEVRVSNVSAIRLYQRCGFWEDGRRPKYYHDGEDALLMSWRPSQENR